uniref:Uncharacterized protein n=1 Tax=Rhipicephalus zambeziensis TaxID=60191 RepID=A0A224YGS0_9ACAR
MIELSSGDPESDFCDLGCTQDAELANSGTDLTRRDNVHCSGAGVQMLSDENFKIKIKYFIRVAWLRCVESVDTAYQGNEICPFCDLPKSCQYSFKSSQLKPPNTFQEFTWYL